MPSIAQDCGASVSPRVTQIVSAVLSDARPGWTLSGNRTLSVGASNASQGGNLVGSGVAHMGLGVMMARNPGSTGRTGREICKRAVSSVEEREMDVSELGFAALQFADNPLSSRGTFVG